jgi:hypothetical protein
MHVSSCVPVVVAVVTPLVGPAPSREEVGEVVEQLERVTQTTLPSVNLARIAAWRI